MLTHNAHQVAARMRAMPGAAQSAVEPVFVAQVQRVAGLMREKAPKFRSTLTNSVGVERRGPLDAVVKPNTAWAFYKEKGTKPGKGVPRFSDPEAADLIAWLESKITSAYRAAGKSKPRRNTMAAVQRNLELRDRYEGLAWHIRHHGTKAQPYIEPTAVEMAAIVARELRAAIVSGLSRTTGGTP